MQIHPLWTTQIEFENAIKEFKEKHERIFLEDGKKKWETPALQKLADFIWQNGLSIQNITDEITKTTTRI